MAQNPLIKRYLDAGMAFTQMTQARAEEIVKDLVAAGEVQAQRAEELAGQLVDRSRENTEKLLEAVRTEVREQIGNLGLATKADIERLEAAITAVAVTSAPAQTDTKEPAEKATTKKAAKKRAAKKSTAKKSTAKKSTAKKSTAKKAAKKAASS